MKTVRIFAVLALCTMALTGLSLAQQPSYRLVADIPFNFSVGSQHLPAGPYMFVVDYGDPVVTLRNTSTGKAIFVYAIRGDGEDLGNPVAVFEVIGDNHTLSNLRAAGHAVNFPEPKAPVALARKTGTVTIAAALR